MRPLYDAVRTNTPATTASYCRAVARTSSISESGVRSDSSIAVRFGQCLSSAGMNVRLGAPMPQPAG